MEKEVQYWITTTTGQILLYETIYGNMLNTKTNETINLSNLSKGIYFINVRIGNSITSRKIVIF
jgi:hypothetical protein